MLEGRLARQRDLGEERKAFLLRAFEDAPIGMALVHTDERIVEANAALCLMLGYSREELLQKTVPEITHPDDRQVEAKPKDDMRAGSSALFVVEKRYVRKDGSVLTGRLSVSAIFDEKNQPSCFIGQLEDITSSQEIQRALESREALFRALVESTTELFCLLNTRGQILYISPNASAFFGLDSTSCEGSALERLIFDADRERFNAALQKALKQPQATIRESLRFRDPLGHIRHFQMVARNRVDVDVLGGVVLSLRDTTEERAIQAQLTRAQRLDSVGRLAGGVAHDFNNMLGVILSSAEFLKEDLAENSPSQNDVSAVEEAALRARDLTQQLLTIGRRHHGAAQSVDVHAALLQSSALLQRLLGEDIEFKLELRAKHSMIMIDPSQLEQIWLNFATNARDAMPDGGHFTISTRSSASSAHPEQRNLELVVEDSGTGIPEEQLEQIFDPFFTTKAQGRGTGLGLATVYGIVQLAKGDIWVENKETRGTRFIVSFPDTATAESPADSGKEQQARGAGHIMVIEDDPALHRTTTRALQRVGYEVSTYADPRDAIRAIEEGLQVDALVTDVVMPHLSGPQAYAAIESRCGELPVVFVSGYSKTMQSQLGQHPDFLSKPFTPKALIAKLQTAISRSALLKRASRIT